MKAFEILDKLFALADDRDFSHTCDTLKAGNPDIGDRVGRKGTF